jgi:hypothetical protein
MIQTNLQKANIFILYIMMCYIIINVILKIIIVIVILNLEYRNINYL